MKVSCLRGLFLPIEPSDEWLQEANRRYRAEDLIPRQRPWQAWKDMSLEQDIPLALDDPRVQRIFRWFEQHTQQGAHQMGPLFRGTFFFDACFWPVDIPVVYGEVKLDVFASMSTMPDRLKIAVARDRDAATQLLTHWTSCADYGLGFEDLQRPSSGGFPEHLLLSGHRELCSSVSLLLSARPNARAALSASFAIELFAKWLLAIEIGLDEQGARKQYGHNLSALLEACRPYVPANELDDHIARAALMPKVSDRYEGAEPPLRYLWEAYLTAQTVAASLTRVKTGRDCQADLKFTELDPDSV